MTTLHAWLVLLAWLTGPAILFFTGCAELDQIDDAVSDLGEEPLDVDNWEWSLTYATSEA